MAVPLLCLRSACKNVFRFTTTTALACSNPPTCRLSPAHVSQCIRYWILCSVDGCSIEYSRDNTRGRCDKVGPQRHFRVIGNRRWLRTRTPALCICLAIAMWYLVPKICLLLLYGRSLQASDQSRMMPRGETAVKLHFCNFRDAYDALDNLQITHNTAVPMYIHMYACRSYTTNIVAPHRRVLRLSSSLSSLYLSLCNLGIGQREKQAETTRKKGKITVSG